MNSFVVDKKRTGPLNQIRESLAFSLVELLVVMGIIAILAAAAIPAITSVVQSNNLTRAVQQVADLINLARQMSSAKNMTIEMRIFKPSGATTSGFTELQLGTNGFVSSSATTPTWTPITRAIILPQSIAISENTTLCPTFTSAVATMPPSGYGPQSGASYHSFEFRPSGIVTPILSPGMSAYGLTIVPSTYASSSTGSLTSIRNYAIVQINPLTATPVVYRP